MTSFFFFVMCCVGGSMVGYNLSKAPTKNGIFGLLGFALALTGIMLLNLVGGD